MKKSFALLFAIGILITYPASSQVGRFLNKVSKSVANEFKGQPTNNQQNANTQPDPKCACENPEIVLDLGGKLKLMYSEISITMGDDGSLLVKDRNTGDFYIVRDGVTQGPVKADDPRLKAYNVEDEEETSKPEKTFLQNEYITKSGEKYLIKFGGKSYGPYAQIKQFEVSKLKDKFVAEVIENIAVSEEDGKKMEEAIKNAKTDQEKRELGMKYSQQMAQKIQQAGGPTAMMSKFVTNIPGVNYDPYKSSGGSLNSDIKYNDILVLAYDKVTDLSNNVLLTLKSDAIGVKDLYVNTPNNQYAYYKYGTLTFSDGRTMSELFAPHLVSAGNLAYMYYSPKSNSIMQCKVSF